MATVKEYADEAFYIESPIPLTNAPRSVRVAAADELDAIVQGLSEQVDEYLASIEKATAAAAMK